MAQRAAPDGWDPPSVVQVTVEARPRRPAPPRLRVLAATGVLGVAALVSVFFLDHSVGTPRHRPERAAIPMQGLVGQPQPSAAAEAYRFPLACLRITRSAQALAGALRRRGDPCWRYGVSVSAILRRIHGSWRLALEAISRSCLRGALPAAASPQLVVCRR